MEIDKAIRESNDRRLKTKYNNAIYVIKRALTLYSDREIKEKNRTMGEEEADMWSSSGGRRMEAGGKCGLN
ncbi:hypothetical protein CFP56_038517 [Quercus suber]|uniref:Uncharacterized protein n=1 Tax=Quercus suber TaxID=58331 RepID=A0AAW0LNR0_QUESU